MENAKVKKVFIDDAGKEHATNQEMKRADCRITNKKIIEKLFDEIPTAIDVVDVVIKNAEFLVIALKPFLTVKTREKKVKVQS